MRPKNLGWLLVILTIGAQALFYLHILPLSLGPRVVLQPWLMRQGYLLYKNIADEHPPLMPLFLLAMHQVVSDSFQVAKLTLVLLISITALLTFWAGKKGGGWLSGILSLVFFVLWSPIFGYGKLWYETFLAPIYILILILWREPGYQAARYLSLTGLLLGVALLVKQHAIVVILGVFFWLFCNNRLNHNPIRNLPKEIFYLLLGIFLPVGIFIAYYWPKANTLDDLVFWLITFNFINNYTQLAALRPSLEQIRLLAPAYMLVLPSVAGLWNKDGKSTRNVNTEIGLILLVTSSLTIYPRFGFFHLQASLPILAWLSGTTLARLIQSNKNQTRLLKGVLWSLLLLWMLYTIPTFYNALQSPQPRKVYEYSNLIPLVHEIRQHIGPTECIYILPDDEATANLYYLTQCLPPKLWIPTSYPWFMIETLKPKAIKALEETAPEWVVYFPGRWGIEQHGQDLLNYVQNHYQLLTKLNWTEGEVWLLKRTIDNR